MTAGVQLSRVTKTFGDFTALQGLDLEIRQGELLTLLGPSGCGKSTTLNLIAGFLEPDSGRIEIGGADVSPLPPFKRNIGVVFQDYALFPHMSVERNVGYGLRARRLDRRESAERVREALDLVKLDGLGQRMPTALSGGQRQRTALARALVIRPSVLLLDEPLSNLDLKLRETLREEIVRVQRQLGVTTVFVTHDQSEALAMSDRIVVMREGRVEQIGTPEDIYERPVSRYVATFVGHMNLVEDEGKGMVGFRPEHAVLVPEGMARSGRNFDGRLTRTVYLGQRRDYCVTLDSGAAVIAGTALDGVHDGDRVSINVESLHIQRFKE